MGRRIKWLVSNASRDTISGQFIAEIDGLRFIAIFSVILFHLLLASMGYLHNIIYGSMSKINFIA